MAVSVGPLARVVIYFAGLTDTSLLELRRRARELGARVTMRFPSSHVTHVIALALAAAKCVALEQSARTVHVVRPSWLHACWASRSRVPEFPHRLFTSRHRTLDAYVTRVPAPAPTPASPLRKRRALEARSRGPARPLIRNSTTAASLAAHLRTAFADAAHALAQLPPAHSRPQTSSR